MKIKVRYKLWQVAVGLVSIGLLFMFFSLFSSSSSSSKESMDEVAKPARTSSRSFIVPLQMFLYMLAFFYITLNYYYHLISNNKKFVSFVKATALIILAVFVYHSFLYNNFPQALHGKYGSQQQLYSGVLASLIPMLILSFLFAYVTVLREALKQRRILEAQKMQLEMEISQANFNFLKAQINPHFLHNTLNFFYAKSLPFSTELSEGILTLSDIMRYALSKGNQKDGKAPLKDEIEHVANVIKISQMRYNNQLNVNFSVTGTIEGLMIIPFVLITLVENAFMHGDLKNQLYPIDIRLDVNGNRLYFYCSNKKKTGAKQPSTGIGLENIKKRLDLAYGDKYKYIVKDEVDFYTTELTITEL